MASYAKLACPIPDEDIPLIRELLAYDSLCENSCTFKRGQYGELLYANDPSPLHWSRQTEWPWAIREAALYCDHDCLDVGGGWSVFKFAVARRCRMLRVLDVDQEGLRRSKITICRMQDFFSKFGNIWQIEADARSIPSLDETYDRVFCISVLEHIPDCHEKCVSEMIRVLKPGGVLLLTMDVVYQGQVGEGNFYVDEAKMWQILGLLGIGRIEPSSEPPVACKINEDRTRLAVVMARYEKPMGE